jgi:hypothetical protein
MVDRSHCRKPCIVRRAAVCVRDANLSKVLRSVQNHVAQHGLLQLTAGRSHRHQHAQLGDCLPVDKSPVTNVCKLKRIPSQPMKGIDNVVPMPCYPAVAAEG